MIPKGYRTVWSGEFQQMQDGERRLMFIIPLSLVLIFILLYLAFHSFVDAIVVLFSTYWRLSLGGIWAAMLTDTNFQHRRRCWFHVDFWRGNYGRIAPCLVVQSPPLGGTAVARSDSQGGRTADSAGDDDSTDSNLRALAGPPFSLKVGAPNSEAASNRRGWQHDHDAVVDSRYLMPVLYSCLYGNREPSSRAAAAWPH